MFSLCRRRRRTCFQRASSHTVPLACAQMQVHGAVLLGCLLAATWAVVAGGMDDIVFGEDPRKPVEVDDALLCHACNAAVLETVTHVCYILLCVGGGGCGWAGDQGSPRLPVLPLSALV